MATTRIIRAIRSGGVVPFSGQMAPAARPGPNLAPDRDSWPAAAKAAPAEAKRRLLTGHVLAAGECETPIVNALVELYAISPLGTVAPYLSAPVLAHLRSLLFRGDFTTIDLYEQAEHVVDAPNISIADIHLLKQAFGYELVASAARLQPDAAFRQMLCNYPAILRPLLCYYHPCSFTSQRLATAVTGHDGEFLFPVRQSGDIDAQYGYYFIVRKQVSGNLFITLYDPSPITWHARWEDVDETPIKLSTRHPLALRSRL